MSASLSERFGDKHYRTSLQLLKNDHPYRKGGENTRPFWDWKAFR